jgi:hypothetical protein
MCLRMGRHVYPGLFFQKANTKHNPSKRVGLVQSGPRYHLIEN